MAVAPAGPDSWPDGRVEVVSFEADEIVARRMYASRREKARARARAEEIVRGLRDRVARILDGGEQREPPPAARACEKPGYPASANVQGLGLPSCSARVGFEVRAFALQIAGTWCAITGGSSSTPDQIRARHAEINSACDRLDALFADESIGGTFRLRKLVGKCMRFSVLGSRRWAFRRASGLWSGFPRFARSSSGTRRRRRWAFRRASGL